MNYSESAEIFCADITWGLLRQEVLRDRLSQPEEAIINYSGYTGCTGYLEFMGMLKEICLGSGSIKEWKRQWNGNFDMNW